MTLLLCSIRPEGPEKPNCFRYLSVLRLSLAIYSIELPRQSALCYSRPRLQTSSTSGSSLLRMRLLRITLAAEAVDREAPDRNRSSWVHQQTLTVRGCLLCAHVCTYTLTLVSSRNRQCCAYESSSQRERTSHGRPARGAPIECTRSIFVR